MKRLASLLVVTLCSLSLVSSFTPKILRQVRPKVSQKKNIIRRRFISEDVLDAVKTAAVKQLKKRSLRNHQQRGKAIASTFQPSDFNPHPALKNPHLQTILGFFIRDEEGVAYISRSEEGETTNIIRDLVPVGKAVVDYLPVLAGKKESPSKTCSFWDERERIDTPDGDFFHVDYKFQTNSEGLVVIVHGLEANSNSTMCMNMARAYGEKNFDVACINFRGCSGVENDTPMQYHFGFTDDLVCFLNKWIERQEKSRKPLYLTGFSLGSNVVLKCLGELSTSAIDMYSIRGAAVTAAPFDLGPHSRQLIDQDFHRIVYAGQLLKSMKKKIGSIVDRFYEGDKNANEIPFDYWGCMNASTLAEIEDGFISPLYGFENKDDYHRQSASLPYLDQIAVPTFVLNAADDPLFNPDYFPWEKDCAIGGVAPIKLCRTKDGGHLGHLFHVHEGGDKPVSSFAPMQLASFINHVHENTM